MPKSIDFYHATTLMNMNHHIRTSFEVSKEFLQWCEDTNPGGLGQGNGDEYVNWHNYMVIFEKCYESETRNKMEYSNPDATQVLSAVDVFVDNKPIMFNLENLEYDSPANKMLTAAKNVL